MVPRQPVNPALGRTDFGRSKSATKTARQSCALAATRGWRGRCQVNLPFFKFFPRDWLGDPQLRLCSLAARGLWADLLCIMYMNEGRRGFLEVGGRPIREASEIARLVGSDAEEVARLISELDSAGVPSRDESGTIFSRRILKDAATIELKRQAGLKGGNPSLVNRVVNRVVKQQVNPLFESCLNPEAIVQKPESRDKIRDVGQGDASQSASEAAPASQMQSTKECLEELKSDPAYAGIDVEREHAKMIRWCAENHKQPTRRRLVNWLNRADRPLKPSSNHTTQPERPSTWELTKRIEANDAEAIEIRNRGTHVATGWSADSEADRLRFIELKKLKSELQKQINQ